MQSVQSHLKRQIRNATPLSASHIIPPWLSGGEGSRYGCRRSWMHRGSTPPLRTAWYISDTRHNQVAHQVTLCEVFHDCYILLYIVIYCYTFLYIVTLFMNVFCACAFARLHQSSTHWVSSFTRTVVRWSKSSCPRWIAWHSSCRNAKKLSRILSLPQFWASFVLVCPVGVWCLYSFSGG